GRIGDLNECKEPCKKTCSDAFYKLYLDIQEANDIYEVIYSEYTLIPILDPHDINNPEELCRTKEFTIIHHSIRNDKEFITCAGDVVDFRTWPGISLETSMISTMDLDGVTCLTVIMESLVKKKQKGAILELKRRHLKKVKIYTNTPKDSLGIKEDRVKIKMKEQECNLTATVSEHLNERPTSHDELSYGADSKTHWCEPVRQEHEKGYTLWVSCDPYYEICNGGGILYKKLKHYWKSTNDDDRISLEWDD
ncbi:hypothetical protein Tco_1276546, partial [Tanacetum coccineum]